MASEIKLQTYLDAAIQASDRARSVVMIMTVATVVAFVAYWNTRIGNWMSTRIEVATKALEWYDTKDGSGIPKDSLAAFAQAKDFVSVRHLTKGELKALLDDWEKVQSDNRYFVRIPFFAVNVDTNDLGGVSGFAFFVIMIMFRFSLAREHANLVYAFQEAERAGSGKQSYELLSMHQVLTTTAMKHTKSLWIWKVLPTLLYLPPLLVQVLIFLNDLQTVHYAWSTSPVNTVLVMSLSGIFLIAIAGLTYSSLLIVSDIDDEWAKIAQKLQFA